MSKYRFRVLDGNRQEILSISDLENVYKLSKKADKLELSNAELAKTSLFELLGKIHAHTGGMGKYTVAFPRVFDSINKPLLSNYGLKSEISMVSLIRKTSFKVGYDITSSIGTSLPERVVVGSYDIDPEKTHSDSYIYIVDSTAKNLDKLFSDRIVAVCSSRLPKDVWGVATEEQIKDNVVIIPLGIAG